MVEQTASPDVLPPPTNWPPETAVVVKPTIREAKKWPDPQEIPVPQWWTDFQARITRPVVQLKGSDFNVDKKSTWPQKGFHRACINGKVEGILHVTKAHISFVEYMGYGVFSGISTSESRFGGKGQIPMTEKKARDFLNGR